MQQTASVQTLHSDIFTWLPILDKPIPTVYSGLLPVNIDQVSKSHAAISRFSNYPSSGSVSSSGSHFTTRKTLSNAADGFSADSTSGRTLVAVNSRPEDPNAFSGLQPIKIDQASMSRAAAVASDDDPNATACRQSFSWPN